MPDFLKRFATTSPASINNQTKQVEAIIATNSPVTRRDNRGPFIEVLRPEGLDLESAKDKPILDSHKQDSINALLGRITQVRISEGQVIAELKFSSSADVSPVFEKIADGTIKAVSVGYEVLERQTGNQNGRRIVEVRRWRIGEVSLVSIPADSNTGFRSKNRGKKMEIDEINDTLETRGKTKGISGETDRTQIRALARNLEIEPEITDKLIDSGATLEVAKAQFFDALQTRNGPKIEITQTQDDPKTFERRVGKALSVRMGLTLDEKDKEAGAIKELMTRSIGEIAIEYLNKAGEDVRGTTPANVFEKRSASLTSSDFPKLLESAGQGVLLEVFRGAESGLKQVATRRDLSDFRPQDAIRLSEMGRLQPLAEDGEIVASSRDESSESLHR